MQPHSAADELTTTERSELITGVPAVVYEPHDLGLNMFMEPPPPSPCELAGLVS